MAKPAKGEVLDVLFCLFTLLTLTCNVQKSLQHPLQCASNKHCTVAESFNLNADRTLTRNFPQHFSLDKFCNIA